MGSEMCIRDSSRVATSLAATYASLTATTYSKHCTDCLQGHRRQVDLRRKVRGRELQAHPQQAIPAVHGQRRPEHQRLAVLRKPSPSSITPFHPVLHGLTCLCISRSPPSSPLGWTAATSSSAVSQRATPPRWVWLRALRPAVRAVVGSRTRTARRPSSSPAPSKRGYTGHRGWMHGLEREGSKHAE